MPLPTTMQKDLGTGGTSYGRSPGGYMTAALSPAGSVQPTQTPGVDPAWSRMFGPATPANLLEQRQATGTVTPAMPSLSPSGGTPTGVAPGGRLESTSKPTPASASLTNAMAPGAFNGNPNNGFSLEKQGGGQSNNQRGTTKPMAPMGQVPYGSRQPEGPAPAAAAPELAPAPNPMAMALQPQAAQGEERPQDMKWTQQAAAGSAEAPPREQGEVAPAADMQPRVAAAGEAAPVAAATPKTYTFAGGQSLQYVGDLPKGFETWTAQRKWDYLKANAPVATPPAQGGGTTTQPGTSSDASGKTGSQGQTLDPWIDPSTHQDATGQGTGAGADQPATGEPIDPDEADFLGKTGEDRSAPYNDDGTKKATRYWFQNNQNAVGEIAYDDVAWWQNFWYGGLGMNKDKATEQGKLPDPRHDSFFYSGGPINVFSDDYNFAMNQLTGAGQKGLQSLTNQAREVLSDLYAQGWYPTIDPNFPGTANAESWRKWKLIEAAGKRYGLIFTTGSSSPGQPPGTDPNTDIGFGGSTADNPIPWQLPESDKIIHALRSTGGKNLSPEQQLAIQEYINSNYQWQVGKHQQRAAYDEAVKLRQENLNDPNYFQYQAAVDAEASRPSTLDWETMRNKYVADQDKLGNQIVQNLSAGAARRGLNAGAVQGVQSDVLRQNANATASGLGDISIKKAEDERDSRLRGIALRQGALGVSSGLRNMSSQQIQQILMGQAPIVQNPAAGVANTGVSLLSAQMALDALDQSDEGGGFGWGDGLGILGAAVGTYFGGPAGGAAGAQLGQGIGGAMDK